MVKTITLSNGVKIVLEKLPFVRSISFGIWVKNGSRNEDEYTNGISHFIEHMLFKGTTNRSSKDIADEIDSIGGQINAYTSKEHTCYYVRSLDTHFDVALDILSDMFFNSKFDSEEIDKEKKVIIEEIDMYEDTPEELAHDILQLNIYKDDPLGFPILGTKENVLSFNTDIFKNYYEKHYHPENTIIAVAGNFEEDEIIKKIEKYFASFSREHKYKEKDTNSKYQSTVICKEKDIEQLHVILGFEGISLGSEDSYHMAIFNTIFGGGMSSTLFQKIREENSLAYSVYSYHSPYKNNGLFSIYAGLNKKNIQNYISCVFDEIKKLHTDKINKEQLLKSKEQIKASYILSLESSSSRMNSIGRSELMLQRILSPKEVIEKIDKVNLEDIHNLTNKIFNLEKVSLSAVGDIKNINFSEMLQYGK